MKNFLRMTLLTATLAGASSSTLAANASNAPTPAQDPVIQHPKSTNDQTTQIKKLHQQFEANVSQISVKNVKDGTLVGVIKSGKWDKAAVQEQPSVSSNIEQQARYYRVKYYFDLNKVLTPEQHQQVQKDITQTLSEQSPESRSAMIQAFR